MTADSVLKILTMILDRMQSGVYFMSEHSFIYGKMYDKER
jgi:hypothetical protein